MTWTDYTDPVADLVASARAGGTTAAAAARQLLLLAAQHAEDKRADPLLQWLGQCCAAWQARGFSAKASRDAFGIRDKPLHKAPDERLLAVYRRLRGRGWTRERTVLRLAFYLGRSTRWVEQHIDKPIPQQDWAADLINRLQ